MVTRSPHDAIVCDLRGLLSLVFVKFTGLGAYDLDVFTPPNRPAALFDDFRLRRLGCSREGLHHDFIGTPGREIRGLVHSWSVFTDELVHDILVAMSQDDLLFVINRLLLTSSSALNESLPGSLMQHIEVKVADEH